MRNISGIYGANTPTWSDDLWSLINLAGFKWAVVRTDTFPSVAEKLHGMGIRVIIQQVDGFNQNAYQSPAAWARKCLCDAERFRPFSDIICLDNEPNLIQPGGTPWYAEQFCRWYRAVLALWRYSDPGGRWKVLFPALSPAQHLHAKMWFDINGENVFESDALAAHSYWPGADPPDDVHLDTLYRFMRVKAPDKDIYILEYGSPATFVEEIEKAVGYKRFVTHLPYYVKCACLFILGGTNEWKDWFLTENMARILGE